MAKSLAEASGSTCPSGVFFLVVWVGRGTVSGDEDAVFEVLLQVFDPLIKLQKELGFGRVA